MKQTYLYNGYLKANAQKLRRDMTKEERHLWYDFLKNAPYQFKRQRIVGNYILDFYCPMAKLAVELDGSQHYDPTGQEYDRQRDSFLAKQGIAVVRYSNSDVNARFSGVCEDILHAIENRMRVSPL